MGWASKGLSEPMIYPLPADKMPCDQPSQDKMRESVSHETAERVERWRSKLHPKLENGSASS